MKVEEKKYKGYRFKTYKITSGNEIVNHIEIYDKNGDCVGSSPTMEEAKNIIEEHKLADKNFCPFCGRGGEK